MSHKYFTALLFSFVFASLPMATEPNTLIQTGMTAATNLVKNIARSINLPDFIADIFGTDEQILDKVNEELEKINAALDLLKLTVEIQAYSTFIANIYRAIKKTLTALQTSPLQEYLATYGKQEIADKLNDLIEAAKDSNYVTTHGLGTVPMAYAKALQCDVESLESFTEYYLKLVRDAAFLRNISHGQVFRLTDDDSHAVSDAFDDELDKCRAQSPSSCSSVFLRGHVAKIGYPMLCVSAAIVMCKVRDL